LFNNLPLLAQVTSLHFLRAHALLSEVGIHPGQYPLLELLHSSQGMSQHEIARKLIIKPSTLTVMLKRLERDGMVDKQRDPNDKRIFRIYLSPLGEEVLADGNRQFMRLEEELYQGFSSSDHETFKNLVTLMRNNLLTSLDKEGQWCPS
jgi:DNA-binding MarR family transcriptional regulator